MRPRRSALPTCTRCFWAAPITSGIASTPRGARRRSSTRCAPRERSLNPLASPSGPGVAMANINRRAKDVDGRVSIGLNPDGPADRQVGLIRLDRPDGSLIALIANYAMHGTVMNGAEPEDQRRRAWRGHRVSRGETRRLRSLRQRRRRQYRADILRVSERPQRRPPVAVPRAARRSDPCGRQPRLGPAPPMSRCVMRKRSSRRRGKQSSAWPEELAGLRARRRRRPLVRLPIRFVRINDTVIWSAPVEMFCEIAMDVREQSPFSHTFYFGYTNGWFGYLPTAKGFEEGGYEPRTSPFSPQVEGDVSASRHFLHPGVSEIDAHAILESRMAPPRRPLRLDQGFSPARMQVSSGPRSGF